MFWHLGILALSPEHHLVLSARPPECQKIKRGGLDQYGTEPFEQQQFGIAGVDGVKYLQWWSHSDIIPGT